MRGQKQIPIRPKQKKIQLVNKREQTRRRAREVDKGHVKRVARKTERDGLYGGRKRGDIGREKETGTGLMNTQKQKKIQKRCPGSALKRFNFS